MTGSSCLALLAAIDHAVIEAALAVQIGLLEPSLRVERLGLAIEPFELLVELADLRGGCRRCVLGLLDLGVDLLDLVLVFLLLLLELLLLGGLQLLALERLESRWTCFQGRRWSATTIQTIASNIAIEVMAKMIWRIGWAGRFPRMPAWSSVLESWRVATLDRRLESGFSRSLPRVSNGHVDQHDSTKY